jgi:hypothetical protein
MIEKKLKDFEMLIEKYELAKLQLFLEIHKKVEEFGGAIISREMGHHRSYIQQTLRRSLKPETLIEIAEAIIKIEKLKENLK